MRRKNEILNNRSKFLEELRSGKYQKGTIRSDEKGNPVFENERDKNGYCCCAVMVHLFGEGKSLPKAVRALGITAKDCKYIQCEINDRNSTLIEDADLIQKNVFNQI